MLEFVLHLILTAVLLLVVANFVPESRSRGSAPR